MSTKSGFCILPWIHASIGSSGKIFPCCRVICFEPEGFGSLHQSTLEEVRSNHKFSALRQQMLDGRYPSICRACHEDENAGLPSMRNDFNKLYPDLVSQIQEQQQYTPLDLRYGEVRFSNKCNLACRTCHLEFSTSWHRDHEVLNGKAPKVFYAHPGREEGLMEELDPHLKTMDALYLAGGEPLISSEHFKLLELLHEKNRTDIQLIYNTNLTHLRHGPYSVLKSWSGFKRVRVFASIDALGERFNLIRHGGNWETVEKNILTLRGMLPHVELVLFPTVSILNVAHLGELIRYFLRRKFIPNLSFVRLNFLYEPLYYQVNGIPELQKERLIKDLELLIAEEASKGNLGTEIFHRHVIRLKSLLSTPQVPDQLTTFKEFTLKLDHLRSQNTAKVCTELEEILKS